MTETEQALKSLGRRFIEYGEVLATIRLCRDLELRESVIDELWREAARLQDQLRAERARVLLSLDLPDGAAYAEVSRALDAMLVAARREALAEWARALCSGESGDSAGGLEEHCRRFLDWVAIRKERR